MDARKIQRRDKNQEIWDLVLMDALSSLWLHNLTQFVYSNLTDTKRPVAAVLPHSSRLLFFSVPEQSSLPKDSEFLSVLHHILAPTAQLSSFSLYIHTDPLSHINFLTRFTSSQPGSFTFGLSSAFNLLPELLCHFCTQPLMEHWVNRFIDTHLLAPTTYQFPVSTGRWFIPSLSLYVFLEKAISFSKTI